MINRNSFLVMNDENMVSLLERKLGGRSLICVKELCIKEVERTHIVSTKFDHYIMDEKYIIFKDYILYFYDKEGEPIARGILTGEKLSTDEKNKYNKIKLQKGPI